MNARDYLSQIYRIDNMINSNLSELERLRLLKMSIPSGLSGNGSGGSYKQEASFVGIVSKITDLEKTIESEINRMLDLNKEIRELINKIQDCDERTCLKLRYLNFLTWETIADQMNLSVKQVYRIHGGALESVRRKKFLE